VPSPPRQGTGDLERFLLPNHHHHTFSELQTTSLPIFLSISTLSSPKRLHRKRSRNEGTNLLSPSPPNLPTDQDEEGYALSLVYTHLLHVGNRSVVQEVQRSVESG